MLDLELLRLMDETLLINYVESYGSEESIAVMNAILKLGELENEEGQTLEEVTKENSRLIEQNEILSSALSSIDEIVSENITNCFIDIFEQCSPRKKLAKEIVNKHLAEIENNVLPDSVEYLADSLRAISFWHKYIWLKNCNWCKDFKIEKRNEKENPLLEYCHWQEYYSNHVALTIDSKCLGYNDFGKYTLYGWVRCDYFEWVNEFVAVFDNDKDFVIGNFEKIVYVTSEKSYNIFMETVTIDEWDYHDI